VAEILLSLLAFALLVALLVREWAFDRERQGLLDRIQAPDAAHAASVMRQIPRPEPVEVPEDLPVRVTDPDLLLMDA
jgi:hypothetical protein